MRSRAFKVALFVVALELQAWICGNVLIHFDALRFYRPDVFARISDAMLARYARVDPLGWPADNDPHASSSGRLPACGSAWGDSLTWGGEVEPDASWVNQLSLKLGCNIANYAFPAYGFDQAVLRYERIRPPGNMVMLGLFAEMLRREVATSWTFYGGMEPGTQLKPYFSLDGDTLRFHPIPTPVTRATIAAHHARDYYMHRVWTELKFPYSLAIARALYVRIARADDYRLLSDAFWSAAHPSGSGKIARLLIDRLAAETRAENRRLVVVFLPHIDRLLADTPAYDQFAEELRQRGDLCVVEPKSVLRRQVNVRGRKALSAPAHHYNAAGNEIIADTVLEGLSRCGLAP